ncbi:MAG: DUF4837 family protein [Chitinophagales bacterium]
MRNILFLVCTTFCLCLSCTNDQVKEAVNYLPNSSGRVDEILLIMDEDDWRANEGEVVREVFMKNYQVLPQPEPIFSLSQVPMEGVTELLQRSASILVISDLSKDNATARMVREELNKFENQGKERPPFFMRRDVWAAPQQVLYVYADDAIKLGNKLLELEETFINLLYKMEDIKAKNNTYVSGVSKGLTKTLKEDYGLDFEVPNTYLEVLKTDTLMWMRHDNQLNEEVSNIMVLVEPYTGEPSPITSDYPIKKIEEMGKLVGTDNEGSYLYPSDKYIPYEQVMAQTEAGKVVKSIGLWSMQNDFMGGAFTSYSFNDIAKKQRVTLLGFVYAPRGKKRILMRRLDIMFRAVKPVE